MMFFQLIRKEDGTRSEALPCKASDLNTVVSKLIPPKNWDKFYILILINDASRDDFVFSKAPLLSVDNYMSITSTGVSP